MAKRTSHAIGRELEARIKALLDQWRIPYEANRRVATAFGNGLELDFWLPAQGERPDVVLECKNFGVEAKSTADSRRRKAQEAFYLLAQIRRHVPGLANSRTISSSVKRYRSLRKRGSAGIGLGSDEITGWVKAPNPISNFRLAC